MEQYSIFVRDLRDRTQCLAVGPGATLADVKELLQERTGVPTAELLLDPVRACPDCTSLAELGIGPDSSLRLSGRLRGGKGGFGSLLRGAGKGAQTGNQDACRDLSGRRLRVVNAEKKLQEWAATEAQRKREKQAEKDARERARAEQRAEATQAEVDAAKQEQHAALSEAAKALRRSMQVGTKRLAAQPVKPAAKRPRYSSDSDADSSGDESGSDSEDLRTAEAAEPEAAVASASAEPGAQLAAAPALQEAA